MSSPIPIACTLAPGALEERSARFAALNRTWLRLLERGPGTLTLTYAAAAEPDLRELVRLERECCAFLTFHLVRHGEDTITLRVVAPDVQGAELLFAPFLGASAAVP
ncbi:MAG TPA: hypothetical protein VFT96_09220 [Gemmatimonadaceae bacterium]|nr:hypothetical protein [Gemmatimonadaceae bacterium]